MTVNEGRNVDHFASASESDDANKNNIFYK